MSVLAILLAIISLRIPYLPLADNSPYLSNDIVRADRAIEPENISQAPIKQDILSLGPQLSAQSAIVVDSSSGAILFAKNASQKRPMASIVKLMTALIFLQTKPNLEQRIAMIAEDDREGDQQYIRPGESAKLRDYLSASLIGSANNATITLARSTGLPENDFTAKMNEKAKELGMRDTIFTEPSGLSEQNISTARDMAKLLDSAGKNETIRQLSGMHRAMIQIYPSGIKRTVLTTNHLLGTIVLVSFGKTGYLDQAMYNLATAVALPNNGELYIVILGSQSNQDRVQDAKNLALWTKRVYKWE